MKILVAYDGSYESKLALERTALIATMEGATVSVISVVPVLHDAHGDPVDPSIEYARHGRHLTDAIEHLKDLGVHAHAIEALGHEADAICEAAETLHASLIVLGARGIEGVSRFMMGSVATRVVQYAPCDVYIARALHHPSWDGAPMADLPA